MKANKNTIIICLILGIIAFIAIIIIKDCNSKLFAVIVGVFTGLVVSLISASVAYFDRRASIFNAIKSNIADVYTNIYIMHIMTGNILEQVQYVYNLRDLNIKLVMGLAELNIDFALKMQIGLFDPIFRIGKKYRAIVEMNEFERDLNNLKLCIGKIQNIALEHDLLLSSIINRNPTLDEGNKLQSLRNLLLIQISKLHGYEATLIRNIDRIAIPFYGANEKTWEQVKQQLLIRAENILKS